MVVVVVVVRGVVVVSVWASGCAHSASARSRRLEMPSLSRLCSPESIVAGSAAKSCSVLLIASVVAVQFAASALRRLRDRFEVALQRSRVGDRDQALAGAAAGDEHDRDRDPQQRGREQSQTARQERTLPVELSVHGH